ncbi:MAG: GNAT family N-acetyltransferase, partial [Nevskiales bacterium]
IAVSPQAAGQGVGRALLNWAEQQAGRWSVQRVKLEVQADNRPALRLYESAGYRVMAELPAYYENGADGLRMVREL